MKHVAAVALAFIGSLSMASTIECEKTSPSELGVETVRFTSQDPKARDVDTLHVTYENGDEHTYRALPGHAFGLVPGSETRTSSFERVGEAGIASVRYSFFILPEENNPTGWSPKNGVTMSVTLPPATERVSFTCKRRLP